MTFLLQCLDSLAFLILWWSSAATLVAGHEVRNWRGAILTAALLGLMAFSFVSAIAAYKGFPVFHWWGTRGTTYAAATIATWLYDHRFGIVRHWGMMYEWFKNTIRRVARRPRSRGKGKHA